jgi:4-amino-4-deoxy-L-arabinose transferase-like glycosyltransferase
MPILTNYCERTNPALIALLVFAGLLFLAGLEKRHLWNADEPRVAGIAAEMARSGDFVVPRLNGRPFLEKPPLYFWAASAAFRLFGENTYTARLISALSAIGGVIVVFLLARSMHFSIRGAFISGFVLATSAEYWSIGRRALTDMMLCFFITAAMACFYQVARSAKGRILWYIGFVLSLGCAVLTKGLVGIIIPFSALVIWLIVERDFSWWKWFILLTGIVLSCVPLSIWTWLLYNDLGKKAVYEAIWVNNFGRFTGEYPQHIEPFYYYLTKFPAQFIPWIFFLPLAGILFIRETRKHDKANPSLFILTWLIVPFILLSISAGKRSLYLLPIYPAAALAVGRTLDIVLSDPKKLTVWFDIPATILAGIAVIVPLAFLGMCLYFHQPFLILALVSIPGFGLGLYAYRLLTKKNLNGFFQILVPSFLVIFLTYDMAVAPISNQKESFEPLFQYARKLRSEGAELGLFKPEERLDGAAVFYLGECVPRFDSFEAVNEFVNSGKKTMVITREENIEENPDIRIINSFDIDNKTVVIFTSKAFAKDKS